MKGKGVRIVIMDIIKQELINLKVDLANIIRFIFKRVWGFLKGILK